MSTERPSRRVACLTTAALLAGCNGTSSYLDATGATGHEEAVLGRWLTITAGVVVLAVCVAILAGMARHRGHEPGETALLERREIHTGLNWIWVGLAITIVILLAAFGGTMVTLQAATHPSRTPSLTMDVTGHQWWWEVTYSDSRNPVLGFTTANEVHLPIGEPVLFKLSSQDVIHSIWVPTLAGKKDLTPGYTQTVWFQADTPGVYRGQCAEFCGHQHAKMALYIIAEPKVQYEAWVKHSQQPAPEPGDSVTKRGQQVFLTSSCALCHAIEGTSAASNAGPNLTGIGGRRTIAAGTLPNTRGNLAGWIVDPQRIKPGTHMPPNALESKDLDALLTYLQSLK